jgi:hypothetical protein
MAQAYPDFSFSFFTIELNHIEFTFVSSLRIHSAPWYVRIYSTRSTSAKFGIASVINFGAL